MVQVKECMVMHAASTWHMVEEIFSELLRSTELYVDFLTGRIVGDSICFSAVFLGEKETLLRGLVFPLAFLALLDLFSFP